MHLHPLNILRTHREKVNLHQCFLSYIHTCERTRRRRRLIGFSVK